LDFFRGKNFTVKNINDVGNIKNGAYSDLQNKFNFFEFVLYFFNTIFALYFLYHLQRKMQKS